MRTSRLVVAAALGLVGWHAQGLATGYKGQVFQVAYQEEIARYSGGQALQRANSPRRTHPVARSAPPHAAMA